MYLRADHAELEPELLHSFIQKYPLGILTTAIKYEGQPTIQSTHVPWVLDLPTSSARTLDARPSAPELGVLRGHIARNNPQAKALIAAAKAAELNPNGAGLDEILVLFHHPAASAGYVTPQWYTDTKPKSGKVVPTWNYCEVFAYGTILVHHSTTDPTATAFLKQQISDLTHQQESTFVQNCKTDATASQWKVSDAPKSYIKVLQKAIIGVEIKITRLAGRFKMSQESSEADREGVAQGFESLTSTQDGSHIAALVRERGQLKAQQEQK